MGKFIDITGNKYGKLTVISKCGKSSQGITWLCKCDCGNEKIAVGSELKRGNGTSCGMCPKDDLLHKKFGFLEPIKYLGLDEKTKKEKWLCRCDCGSEVGVCSTILRTGRRDSCGCKKAERIGNKVRKHGMRNTRIYRIWNGMKQRCLNPNNKHYNDYGGRGIIMCEDWIDSFESFYEWSIKNRYTDILSIDRIDPDGNYEPANCRWTNQSIQASNKRVKNNTKEKNIYFYNDKYYVRCKKNGKNICNGCYDNINDAIIARNKMLESLD